MYKDPQSGRRAMLMFAALFVVIAVGVLAAGFLPGLASVLSFFCILSTAGTLLVLKLFD